MTDLRVSCVLGRRGRCVGLCYRYTHVHTLLGSFEVWRAPLIMEETTAQITNRATICQEESELSINQGWSVSARGATQRTRVWSAREAPRWDPCYMYVNTVMQYPGPCPSFLLLEASCWECCLLSRITCRRKVGTSPLLSDIRIPLI